MNIYPFSLFAMAADGQTMTPWERANYKFWQYLSFSMGGWLLLNLPTIYAALSGTGTNFWEQIRSQVFLPFVVALIAAVVKYHSAQTDVVPAPSQPLKIVTASKRIKAAKAGPSDVGNKPAPVMPPVSTEPTAAA
jgi:hypothetical protein